VSLVTVGLLVAGLVLLLAGAEGLVRGASGIAARLRIPPLVIGLTVVAFGTSAPEFAVSLRSTFDGQTGLAVGNVVGSNIFNVLFILGLSAIITPLAVSRQLVRVDVPIMATASAVVWFMAVDGFIGRLEGSILASTLLLYLLLQVKLGMADGQLQEGKPGRALPGTGSGGGAASAPGRSGASPEVVGAAGRATPILVQAGMALAGLGLLVLGARWLVAGAVEIASALGISDLVIGLTVIAGGTSLPEVATSVLASLRGERDIAVGNVVGSNLFNILGVLGITAAIVPGGLPVPPAAPGFDLPFMTAAALACLPIFFTGLAISRWEGGVFVAYYLAYVSYLVLRATEHDALPLVSWFMVGFAVPLTLIVLAGSVLQARHRRRSTRGG
jgi:cation:H+ antiporter